MSEIAILRQTPCEPFAFCTNPFIALLSFVTVAPPKTLSENPVSSGAAPETSVVSGLEAPSGRRTERINRAESGQPAKENSSVA